MKTFSELPGNKRNIAVAMVVLIVIITAAAVGMLPSLIKGKNRNYIDSRVDELARQQASALDSLVSGLTSSLAAQSATPDIAAALQQASIVQLHTQEDNLRRANAGAFQVRLIPASNNFPSTGLRFSQLDRLNRSARGETVYPEAFEENNNRQFDVIIPIKDKQGTLLGHVIFMLDVKRLSKELHDIDIKEGETVLQQVFNKNAVFNVFRLGDGNSMDNASRAADTAIPHWKVVVVPGSELAHETVISPLFLFALQGMIIVAALAGLFLVNKYARKAMLEAAAQQASSAIQVKGARRIDKAGSGASADAEEPVAPTPPQDDELTDPLFHQASDVFDLDSDDLLEVRAIAPQSSSSIALKPLQERVAVPSTIFRDYDIRGNADQDITDDMARQIGLAFGSECIEQGQHAVILAGDGRLSTPRIKAALQEGLLASGCEVIDVGNVPTPLMYFAVHTLNRTGSGIMVTASHNQASDNGFKMVINGTTLSGEQVQRIRQRIENRQFASGSGSYSERDIIKDYVNHVTDDIVLAASYKIVVDCGNGIAGRIAPLLLEELGCDIVPLYCDVDGHFPNHNPDPSVMANLDSLIATVQAENADLGLAFDGDGDRLGVVTASGQVILPDLLLMLFAKDIVSRNPGADVVFDVKSTRRLNNLISSHGGRPVMWKSGHSHIKNKMAETGALLGGELSGHIFFKERWFGFDDGIYSAARLLEIMSIRDQDLDSIFASFPPAASTPEILLPVAEERKFSLVARLAEKGEWGNGKVTTLDGVRVDFAKGWGLVRASNTSAALTLRFEADDADALATVQAVFRQQLQAIDSGLPLPF